MALVTLCIFFALTGCTQPKGYRVPSCCTYLRLPFHHRDPFDRLMAAQALEEGLTIVSVEAVFRRSGMKRIW